MAEDSSVYSSLTFFFYLKDISISNCVLIMSYTTYSAEKTA